MIPNSADSELERLRFDYEEKLTWRKAKDKIAKKLLEEKIRESNLRVEGELANLQKTETAMLNILEDARELEERLKAERQRSEAIISSMAEGLVVISGDCKIVSMNKTAEKLLGVEFDKTRGTVLGKVWNILEKNEMIPEKDSPAVKTLRTGETVIKELSDNIYYQIASGKKFPVTIATAPLKYGETIIGAVIVFRDVTDEKRLDESKSSFISIASHQLRTPLTAIRLFIEMLGSGQAGRLNKTQKEYIEDVNISTKRMIGLVNDLLNLSRIESGKLKSAPASVRIDKVVQSTIDEAEILAKERNLKLVFKKPKNIIQSNLDADLFRQVIHNLLTNAIRYSTNGKKNDIIIKMEKNGKECVVSVQDFGIGIPDEARSRLFDRFYRADNAIKADANGTGVGLYTIKMILERMNGRVWFESQAGKGTTFYAAVPIKT